MQKLLLVAFVVIILFIAGELFFILTKSHNTNPSISNTSLTVPYTATGKSIPLNFHQYSGDNSLFVFLGQIDQVYSKDGNMYVDFETYNNQNNSFKQTAIILQKNDLIPLFIEKQTDPNIFPTSKQFTMLQVTNQNTSNVNLLQNKLAIFNILVNLPPINPKATSNQKQAYQEFSQNISCNQTFAQNLQHNIYNNSCQLFVKQIQVYVQ